MHEGSAYEDHLASIGVEGQAILSPAYQALRVAGDVGNCDGAYESEGR